MIDIHLKSKIERIKKNIVLKDYILWQDE